MNALQLSTNDFRALAARVTELAADYLVDLEDLRTFPEVSGEASLRAFAETLPEKGLGPAAFDALAQVFRLSRPPSARFFGYVHGSGEPVAALADLLASVLNQNVTAWRSSPAAVSLVPGPASCMPRVKYTCRSPRRWRCSGSDASSCD